MTAHEGGWNDTAVVRIGAGQRHISQVMTDDLDRRNRVQEIELTLVDLAVQLQAVNFLDYLFSVFSFRESNPRVLRLDIRRRLPLPTSSALPTAIWHYPPIATAIGADCAK